MKSILIIEDDPALTKTLIKVLTNRYEYINHASTQKKAYQLIQNFKYDLIILDRILLDGDSLDLIEAINQLSPESKILVLSSKAETEERIKGLEFGADDYLPKPFSLTELLLRVKNLMDKVKLMQQDVIKVKSLTLYINEGLVKIKEKKIQFRNKEFQILKILVQYRTRVVTRDMIIDRAWYGVEQIPLYKTIDIYIRKIRIKLGEYSPLIKTVKGFGYRFDSSILQ